MNRWFWVALALLLFSAPRLSLADTFGSGANSFEIDFVTVGNPGNPADTLSYPVSAGSVPYSYRIGKYEISEQMIDKANALGGLGITKDTRGPNKPATSITWFEAAQFVNWLNTSAGAPPAYKFDAGDNFQLWSPGDPGYNSSNQFRNSSARYFLPSLNEWYKAAYYDPTAGVYYDYPTGSNTPPLSVPNGTTPETAVFWPAIAPANVTQAGGLSPFGTVAQGGNVAEWNETGLGVELMHIPDVSARVFRGGDWVHFSSELLSLSVNVVNPSNASMYVGIRVARIIPEPAGAAIFGTGVLILLGFGSRVSIERRPGDADYRE